jgi:hypothetical protein
MENTFKFILKDVVVDVPDTNGVKIGELTVDMHVVMVPEEHNAYLRLFNEVMKKIKF